MSRTAPARKKTAKRRSSKRRSTTKSRQESSVRAPRATEALESGSVEVPRKRATSNSLLRELGLIGMDRIEPVVLAALATEAPLLLIGPHGTAKSLLLLRLSEALGLAWRHYNASLLNYDDLVGYPMPDERGQLRFVQTPASIWDAQTVFLDEISRCRPDMQNRLFSIVHEKRVQGMPLERLVYRWAAMNPPVTDEIDRDSEAYAGSEPLDAALADRFNFVFEVPRWQALSESDRERVIRSSSAEVDPEHAKSLRDSVGQVQTEIPVVEQALGSAVAEYVRVMADQLPQLGLQLSGRRAAMLYRNIVAVHAARLTRGLAADLGDSAFLTVENSLPQRAQGVKVDLARLTLVHKTAWEAINLEKLDPRRLLVSEVDPVRRAIRAATLKQLSTHELSAYVADGLAEAALGGRHALASFVVDSPAVGKLNAAVAEQVAELHSLTIVAQDVKESVRTGDARHRTWERIVEALAELPANQEETTLATNLLAALFAKGDIASPGDVDSVLGSWRCTRELCRAMPLDGNEGTQGDEL